MDTTDDRAQGGDTLLNLVDFKWLMAGLGWRVDLSRLQSDKGYGSECLQRALGSESKLLRERGADLLGRPPCMTASRGAEAQPISAESAMRSEQGATVSATVHPAATLDTR